MEKTIDHKSRDHALLSASSSARWLLCPPSAVAAELYPEQDTEYTREGTLAHEVAEWVASGRSKKGPPLPKGLDDGVTSEMLECAHAYADYIQEQIQLDSAVVLLEQRVDFSPWAPGGFGTCDCVIIQGDRLTVIDYKYGLGVAVEAEGNSQMMLYALGALNDFGFAGEIRHVDLHIFQPRLNNTSSWYVGAAELLDWGDAIRPIAAQAAWGEGEYSAGPHCRFCPHAGRCPTLTESCLEFVEHHGLRVGIPTLAPWQVADVLLMEQQITLWLKRVKAQALDTLLEGGEIPGFKVVEGKLGNRKWTDEIKVVEALKAAGYQLGDITETKLLTPAAMDKSIGKKKVAELLAGLIDRAPGAPTVVPENDKRAAFDRTADFDRLS